jgi:hypothetical protein
MNLVLPLLQHGLVYGLILSGLLITLTFVIGRFNIAIFAGDYPPDIKAKFGPLDARTERQKKVVAAVLVLVIVVTLGWMVWAMPQASLPQDFISVFVAAFAAAFTFNLIDLLILDWLMFVTWRPSFIVLPGTEGMAGYRDYGFHFHGFLIGLRFCFAAGLLTALVTVGLTALSALGH